MLQKTTHIYINHLPLNHDEFISLRIAGNIIFLIIFGKIEKIRLYSSAAKHTIKSKQAK
jgi:hypothetical protein